MIILYISKRNFNTNFSIYEKIISLKMKIKYDTLSYLNCKRIIKNLTCGRVKTNYSYPRVNYFPHSTFISQELLNINYTISNIIRCSDLNMLIGILTRPECLYERLIVRQIIKYNYNIKYIFFSGISRVKSINTLINQEREIYNDMIVFNIESSYYNCSLIMINIYKYIYFYCKNIKWILKLDLDTYFNINIILSLINSTDNNISVIGSINRKPKLICNSNYKWSITCVDNNLSTVAYPSYPYGPGFLFKYSIIKCINEFISIKKDLIWIEDVLFGVIMKYCGLIYRDITNITEITYKPKNDLSLLREKAFIHGLHPIEILLKSLIDIGKIKI